jgi:hypothetical protein
VSRTRRPRGRRPEDGPYRRSMVQVQIGTRVYDAIYEPNCRTCTHPARMLIEEKLLQSYSYRQVAALYSGTEIDGPEGTRIALPTVSHQSINNHFRLGHMPLEAATLRKLADRRSQQLGQAYEDRAEQFVDHIVLAEATVQRTYERMVTGEIQPEVKDGLAAAALMAKVEADTTAGLDAEAWSEAMTIYFETAREVMDPLAWGRFTQALSQNPILSAIERRMNPTDEDQPLVIEGATA